MSIFPWQQKQWRVVRSQWQQQRMPHALLLTGLKGMGKLHFAEQLAQRVLCDHAPDNEFACGECRSCHLWGLGHHPDFYRIGLGEKSKAIKVDQVRRLSEKLAQKAQRGGYQIALLDPADTMNRAAANALLKTLEEPAGNVLLLLVAEQPSRLPATIMSRCQTITFPGVQDVSTFSWLQEKVDADAKTMALLLKLSGDAPLQVVALAENNYLELRNQLLHLLSTMSSGSVDFISKIPGWLKQDSTLWMQALMTIVGDIARLQLGIGKEFIVNADCMDTLYSLSKDLQRIAVQNYLKQLLEARQLLKSSANINPQLLIENLLIDWRRLG